MTTYLLPAPRSNWLLPAWASPIPAPVRPGAALSEGEAAVLLAALVHHDCAARGEYRIQTVGALGAAWVPVSKVTRSAADNLVLYGYLQKHPDRRKKMWYALTPDGVIRARTEAAAQAEIEYEVPPEDRHERLGWARQRNLEALARELAHQGFVVYPEAGRGVRHGEQAFYNVFTREIVLYRYRLGDYRWRKRTHGYYRTPGNIQLPTAAELAAIPF